MYDARRRGQDAHLSGAEKTRRRKSLHIDNACACGHVIVVKGILRLHLADIRDHDRKIRPVKVARDRVGQRLGVRLAGRQRLGLRAVPIRISSGLSVWSRDR